MLFPKNDAEPLSILVIPKIVIKPKSKIYLLVFKQVVKWKQLADAGLTLPGEISEQALFCREQKS